MNKKRRRRGRVGLLLTLLGLAVCSHPSTTANEHSLMIAVENDIQTLDPAILSDPYTSRILWQMYEGLLGLDAEGKPIPLLAESWRSDDRYQRWTVKIRPHVLYHPSPIFQGPGPSRTVNAYDVLYSYTRFAAGFGSFIFSGVVEGFEEFIQHQAPTIKGFVVRDSLTFEFRLLKPEPTFIYRLTSPYLSIMPREAVEKNPNEFGRTVCVGSGPFMLQTRTATEVSLVRHPHYWKPTAGNVRKILFRVEKNPQLRINQFENQVYDIMQVPIPFLPRFIRSDSLQPEMKGRFHLFTRTTFNIHYLGLNCLELDVHLRRAIAFAINKHAIVESLLYGQAQIATSPVAPGMQNYLPPPGLSYHPDSARFELTLSGYQGQTISLLVSDAYTSEQLGQVIQNDLAQVGIHVVLQKLDLNSLISRIFSGDKPDLFILFSEWIFGAPEFIIDSYNSTKRPNPNLFGYRNPWVDRHLESWRHTHDRAQINQICREAEAVALAEAPAVWLFHLRNVYLTHHRVENLSISANQYWNLADVRWREE